jgi:hypothetical protein
MSGSKDIFAQKLKESQEQGLRLQEELQKRQGNELSSIFLTRNKPSTAQVGKPLDRGLFQQKSVAYHDMFTSKNNIDHMLGMFSLIERVKFQFEDCFG